MASSSLPPVPAVPDLARAAGSTRDEVISWFLVYYDTASVPWNYRSGIRCVKTAYRGLHDIKQLTAGADSEKTKAGRTANADIIGRAAPLAFGRTTQVFDLSRRRFSFGRDLYSGYRIPFFFVENGIVKLYYLQPRKEYHLTYDQLCMVATIHKRFLLDTEFFGQPVDVEYVDLSADPITKVRGLHRYSLSSLELWPEKRLADRLTLISEALDYVRTSGLVKPWRRQPPRAADMPLFD
jgi:hypothetical protein